VSGRVRRAIPRPRSTGGGCRVSWRYVGQRLLALGLTVWVAVTLNFVLARVTPLDPIAGLLGRMASRGRITEGGAQILQLYTERFALDQPLIVQYFLYLRNLLLHGDLGYSLSYFPAKVESVVLGAIPWTLGLLLTSILIAFTIGNIVGALAVWPRAPRAFRYLIYVFMPFSAVPFYLLALILLFVLAIQFQWLPLGGTFTLGSSRGANLATLLDLARHAALPVMSIALGLIGFWALSMRGVMATVVGADYLTYARAKGLRERRVFFRYGMRNALLPQVTALGIDLGLMVSGQVLVEVIFNFPGVGTVLYNALRTGDYFVIQGVVLFIILSVAFATFLVDMALPLLDPRIRHSGASP
jgi:peptide/nickel transport system permease protein